MRGIGSRLSLRPGVGGAAATVVAVLAGLVLAACSPSPPPKSALPPIRHVFVINLENKGYSTTFGANSPAPYLAQTLRAKGALLTQYYGIGHNSLPNYLAQVSGQGPNPDTQGDCPVFTSFTGSQTVSPGQLVGRGCVYPASAKTIADQLAGSGHSWRGYMEDMGNTPSREAATCGRPQVGAADHTQRATVGDEYAARHDPFVYFDSLVSNGSCQANVVPLSRLPQDLVSASTTPSLSYITPNLCDDGHDKPCVDGRPGGLATANDWLATWVPRILASPAYQQDGLLVVTFDESDGDSSACCGEGPAPNAAQPGISGPGGGRIGAVLVSRYITPGTTSNTAYNHYSLLASLEDLFGLPYLGYAGQPGLPRFGSDVYTAYHP